VPSAYWAHTAIDYVANDHLWMRDFGSSEFRPERLENRRQFARALIKAFAGGASPQRSLTFSDLAPDDPYYRFAAVAVERGWMTAPNHAFEPRQPVTVRQVHRGLVLALGLRAEAAGLGRLHTADGTRLDVPSGLGTLTLGMVLGLRYDHADETLEVGPSTALSRAEVAYSLWRAHQAATVSTWKLSAMAPYASIELPNLRAKVRRVVEFGARYVGYPYVWAGEWATATTSQYCCGTQPIGGFDCSGIVWWTMKAAEGGFDNTPIRGYAGWSITQRSSAEMAQVGRELSYADARPGDLLFFDGNTDGTVDHVSLFIGKGWALDSSNSYGGVSIIRVGEGWYREHFVHSRRIIGS
ncbi:MAG: NlpC/P60 family protein, partial [Nocardioidaceae bacterium]